MCRLIKAYLAVLQKLLMAMEQFNWISQRILSYALILTTVWSAWGKYCLTKRFVITCSLKYYSLLHKQSDQSLEKVTIPWAGISCNKVSKFPQDIATNSNHVLMAWRWLQSLKYCLSCITLNVIPVNDNLDHTIPNLWRFSKWFNTFTAHKKDHKLKLFWKRN